MAWQDRFRALGDELIAGTITTGAYRERLDEILAEAEQDSGRDTGQDTGPEAAARVHIPASAALESPSGEMTQIVGTDEVTTPVANTISAQLDSEKTDS